MPARAQYTPLFERKDFRRCGVLFIILFTIVLLVILIVVIVPIARKEESDESPSVAPLVMDGQWGDWRQWSQCSATCEGGTQLRSRRCNNPAPLNGGGDCLGNSTDMRSCHEEACPDCERVCPSGGALVDCVFCQCNGSLRIRGQVLDSSDGLPVQNMLIYANSRQVSPQAITDHQGLLQIDSLCPEDPELNLIAHKPGYMEKSIGISVSATEHDFKLIASKDERPVFTTHPRPFVGFAGERLELTCFTDFHQLPLSFEWYKDDRLLRETETVESSTGVGTHLIIESAEVEDTGSYQCRAMSQTGKTFSKPANVIIKEGGEDTCASEPLTHIVGLPITCQDETGKDYVNAGRCQTDPCKTSAATTGGNSHCCGPIRNEAVQITCADVTYQMLRVAECGCVEGKEPEGVRLRIRVMIQSERGLQRAPYREVRLKTGEATQTDDNGEVQLEAPWDEDYMWVQFIPRAWDIDFMTQIRLIHYKGAAPGDVIPVEVILQAAPDPVILNTTETSVLEIPGAAGRPTDMSLTLPPRSFLNADGDPVVGTVDVYVTLHDARDLESLSTAPGDFTYETEEGYIRQLQTNGVISLMALQNGKPLNICTSATLRLNIEQLGIHIDMNGEPDTLLWTLDQSSGRWVQAGSLKFEGGGYRRYVRQLGVAASGEVDLRGSVAFINLDKPIYEGRTCEVKVKAFANEAQTIPASTLTISVYTKSESGIGYIGSVQRSVNQKGWACLPIPCGFQHEIIAQSFLFPVTAHKTHNLPSGFSFDNIDDGIGVSFRSPFIDTIQTGSGPIHRYSARTCENSTGNDYSFVFILGRIARVGALYPVEPLSGKSLSWYPSPPRVCMIRIETPNLVDIDVIAESRQGDANGPSYGTYVTGLNSHYDGEFRRTRHIACIQVRCPVDADDDGNTDGNAVETHVDINFLRGVYDGCIFSDFRLGTHTSVTNYDYDYDEDGEKIYGAVADPNGSIYVKERNDRYVALGVRHNVPSTGFYIREEETEEQAYSQAYYQCLTDYSSLAIYTCDTPDDGANDYDYDEPLGPPSVR